MLRVLFVTIALPYPPVNGQKLRNWSLIQALVEEGHEVSILSFADGQDPDGREQLSRVCHAVEVVPIPIACRNSLAGLCVRLFALPLGLPQGVLRFRSRQLTDRIQSILAAQAVDIVVCDDIYLFKNVRRGLGIPVLLNKHDLTHVILQRYADHEKNPLKRAYARLEGRRLRTWEGTVSAQADGVMICSQWDANILLSLAPQARMTLVPNVIDVTRYNPAGDGQENAVLFFGSFEWFPNRDGMDYLAARILPELRALVPGVRLVVAGRDPSGAVGRRLKGLPGVEFLGSVPEIQPVIGNAAVVVVPLRIGSGTRLKILEAAAMEKPIVSTSLGAEGLDFVHGQEIVIEDEPSRFAREVAALLKDPKRRRQLGRAARSRVEQHYSLPVLRESIRRALAPFTGHSPAAREPKASVVLPGDEGGTVRAAAQCRNNENSRCGRTQESAT